MHTSNNRNHWSSQEAWSVKSKNLKKKQKKRYKSENHSMFYLKNKWWYESG